MLGAIHIDDVAQQDITLRYGAAVDRFPRDREAHHIDRLGNYYRVDPRMGVVDHFEQTDRPARGFVKFAVVILDQHQFVLAHIHAVGPLGGDKELVRRHPYGEGPVGGKRKHPVVGAVNEFHHLRAQFAFMRRVSGGNELRELHMLDGTGHFLCFRIKRMKFAYGYGFEFDARQIVQRLKTLESLQKVLSGTADAVVFQHDAVHPLFKLLGYPVAEFFAAGDLVGRETDLSANVDRLGEQRGIWYLLRDAERHQRRRMGMEHRFHVGTDPIDMPVKRKLAGGFVDTFDRTVFFDANDVLRTQRPLVDARGTDPHIAVGIHDGEVAAAGGGHTVAVQAFHDDGDEVARMNQVNVHNQYFPLLMSVLQKHFGKCFYQLNSERIIYHGRGKKTIAAAVADKGKNFADQPRRLPCPTAIHL